MREYAPLAAVVTAICVLAFTVYARFISPPDHLPIELHLGAEVTQRLQGDKVEMKLLSAQGEAKALITRWSTAEPGKLLVRRFDGPHENVTYSYLVIYWSNGAATLHEIKVQFAA